MKGSYYIDRLPVSRTRICSMRHRKLAMYYLECLSDSPTFSGEKFVLCSWYLEQIFGPLESTPLGIDLKVATYHLPQPAWLKSLIRWNLGAHADWQRFQEPQNMHKIIAWEVEIATNIVKCIPILYLPDFLAPWTAGTWAGRVFGPHREPPQERSAPAAENPSPSAARESGSAVSTPTWRSWGKNKEAPFGTL